MSKRLAFWILWDLFFLVWNILFAVAALNHGDTTQLWWSLGLAGGMILCLGMEIGRATS